MDNAQQRSSQLKQLIEKGREQGHWLTYAQVNDHLPDDIVDPEQIEDIINMINDMGIKVFEEEPEDADSLILNDSASADNDDEAAQADAEQTVAFLEDFLGAADPFETERRDTLRVGDLLHRAARSVEHDLAEQPRQQGRLYIVLGRAFEGLGRYTEADSVLRLALARFEGDPPRRSEAAEALGGVLIVTGGEAAYAEAESLFREALTERLGRLGPDHLDVAGTRNSLALALFHQGAFGEAETEYRRALAYHRRAVPVDAAELAFVTKKPRPRPQGPGRARRGRGAAARVHRPAARALRPHPSQPGRRPSESRWPPS